jgi:coenzyme F420-reducing hydrogenase alpha subunit
VAAETALQAAQGRLPTEKELSDRAAKVRCETALEHLWHMMLDWPQLCGLSRRETEFAECRRACMRAKSASEFTFALQTTTSLLLDKPIQDWLACDAEKWNLWKTYSSALGAKISRFIQRANLPDMPSVERLPQSSAQTWAGMTGISQPEFSARPSLNGASKETGVVARRAEHDLVSPLLAAGRNIEARFVARLVELAHIASGHAGHPNDWVDAAECGNGVGLARVETARGVLIHRAVVENGVVADYAVIAPTEWNFHPQGAFARDAACLAAQDDAGLLDQARMLALSLDPCVAYEVVLEHA